MTDARDFILAHTRIQTPPLLPELQLHLADDAVVLWEQTEAHLQQTGLAPPFWAFAWAGGQALARHVLDHPDLVRGRRVLDVASGSGMVGIAAAKAGAAAVTCADIDDLAARAVELNAALSAVGLVASTADPLAGDADADIILVGDLFYDRAIASRLTAWLHGQAARGCAVLLGDPGRRYLPREQLCLVAEHDVPTTRTLEDADLKRTGVWRLRD